MIKKRRYYSFYKDDYDAYPEANIYIIMSASSSPAQIVVTSSIVLFMYMMRLCLKRE